MSRHVTSKDTELVVSKNKIPQGEDQKQMASLLKFG